VVIDDAQYLNGATLQVLQRFLDRSVRDVTPSLVLSSFRSSVLRDNSSSTTPPTPPSPVDDTWSRVRKNRLLIGLITDFPHEGSTSDVGDFTKLMHSLLESTREIWGEWDQRLAHLIDVTLPFRFLTSSALKHLVSDYTIRTRLPQLHREVGLYNDVDMHFTGEALTIIVDSINTMFPNENGRGVTKWVDQQVVPMLRTSLLQLKHDKVEMAAEVHVLTVDVSADHQDLVVRSKRISAEEHRRYIEQHQQSSSSSSSSRRKEL
jgi:hypothetical protein